MATRLSVVLALAAMLAGLAPVAPEAQDGPVFQTRDLPTLALQQARRQMIAGQAISVDEMRALADLGDGLAAYRLAQQIEALGDPALLSDAAHYYAVAMSTGRAYAVAPLLRVMGAPDVGFPPARLEELENTLQLLARQGNARVADALIEFYSSGRPFGPQPGRAERLRLYVAKAGDAEAAMALVLEALSGRLAQPLDEAQVTALLNVVDATGDLGMQTTAQNLRRMIETGGLPPARAATASAPTTDAGSDAETAPEEAGQ